MQICITLQSRVLSIPLPRIHWNILSAKQPLQSYLLLAKALQPYSTILGPRGHEEVSDARDGGGDILSFKKKKDLWVCPRSRFVIMKSRGHLVLPKKL